MKSITTLSLLWSTLSTTGLADLTQSPPLHCASSTNILSTLKSCLSTSSSHEIYTSISNVKASEIVIDTEQHDPRPYFPWTHKPICYTSPTNALPKLCLYTNASFSSGRGISIFTTPSLAHIFSQLPAFTLPHVTAHANANHHPPSYVKSLPGRGKGMLAARDLKRGELITAYTPLLLVYREEVLGTMEREGFLRRGVEQLNVKSRQLFEGMAKIYHDERVKTQDVVKANVFGLEVGGMEHLSVWPEPARCNHACGPNGQYRIDHDSLIHYANAARDIAKDEEITLTYINPFNPYTERQQQLSSAFHFSCDCSRCKESSDSDLAINKIKGLEKLLGEWNPPVNSRQATIKDAEKLIALYTEENLHGFLDIPYGHAALMYSAAGDEKGVKKYSKLAMLAVGLKEGEGNGDWHFWKRMQANPQAHWSWEKRKVR